METLRIVPENIASSKFQMNSVSATFKSKIRSFTLQTRFFCSCSSDLIVPVDKRSNGNRDRNGKGTIKAIETQLRDNWLASLSFPLPDNSLQNKEVSKLVIGIDPDVSGAVAVLRDDSDGCSAQVFDTPHLQMLVGKRVRKRLDAKSMVHLLRSFEAPIGTIAYLEQSVPFPKDGKQGWWSGGFGYGLWIGVLVASGFSVIPIPSLLWKNKFELSGGHLCKDDSRRVATELFPSLESLLRRKKDHGRAEALLIAAYGRGLQKKTDPKDEADLSLMSSTQDHLLQPVSLVSLC